MLIRNASTLGVLSLLFTGFLACTGSQKGETDSGGETETSTGSSGASGATTTSMTDSTGSETASSVTTGPGTTDTDGALPGACDETDPAVSAQFEVLIDGQAGDHMLALTCMVEAVTAEAAMSVTALTCDDAGTPLAVTLRLPAAPEGEVAWAAGDAVELDSMSENFDVYSESHLELRGADTSLLAVGYWPRVGPLIKPMFAPITVALVMACGSSGGLDARSYQLDFELAGQPPVSIFSGHRGALTIDADASFAIDVERAVYDDCCHASESFSMLVRRVKTG